MRNLIVKLSIVALAGAGLASPQAAEPNGGGVEPGVMPKAWITGGPNCVEVPDWQVHEYNEDFYIIRESGCTNYEKPFLYLIFGEQKALLVDTGAGKPDTGYIVNKTINNWLKMKKRDSIELVVSHSHSHGDHVAGDKDFKDKPNVQFVLSAPAELSKAFGIKNWPTDVGKVDLGNRVIDVIPIPGHDVASVAYYDAKTGVMLTGDSLYPGRLYVVDWPAFVASTQRMVDFTQGKIVTYMFGAHIEQRKQPYRDYVVRTSYQPEEHVLELGRGELLELNDALKSMKEPAKVAYRDFTIWPREPHPAPATTSGAGGQ
jgi:hydroxyacylglutathione hydrolase